MSTSPNNHPRGWSFPMMRWDKLSHLYARALAEDVELRDDPDYPGLFALASSGTKKGVWYRVNEFLCACDAGRNGMDCKHRALYLVRNMQRLGRVFYTPAEEATWVDQTVSGSSDIFRADETPQ